MSEPHPVSILWWVMKLQLEGSYSHLPHGCTLLAVL